jgi:RecJ-like exonuclease
MSQDKSASDPQRAMNPGDEAPPGMPGTGEDTCPECHGSGTIRGAPCINCGGRGKVVRGIGGA